MMWPRLEQMKMRFMFVASFDINLYTAHPKTVSGFHCNTVQTAFRGVAVGMERNFDNVRSTILRALGILIVGAI